MIWLAMAGVLTFDVQSKLLKVSLCVRAGLAASQQAVIMDRTSHCVVETLCPVLYTAGALLRCPGGASV